jgi:hypothetical protein
MGVQNLIYCVSVFFIGHPLLQLILFTQSAGEPDILGQYTTRWLNLRKELNTRHEARRQQHRFRKFSERYLAVLEEKLIKERLPT